MELGDARCSIDDLLARLDSSIARQKHFLADAAHQLKTPVSGLKAQIELALREQDPERLRHALAQTQEARAAPLLTVASAWSFVVGLVALAAVSLGIALVNKVGR